MQNFSCLGWLKLLNYTFPGGRPAGRPAKPEINANLSPAWSAGAWAELGKKTDNRHEKSHRVNFNVFIYVKQAWASCAKLRLRSSLKLDQLDLV